MKGKNEAVPPAIFGREPYNRVIMKTYFSPTRTALSLMRKGFLLLCILVPAALTAQTMMVMPHDPDKAVHLDVECHSGAPLVLEFVLKAPEDLVRSVSFDFESDGVYDLTVREPQEEVVFRGIPFRRPGTYHITAYLHTVQGNFIREYEVAFTDFVWGRDNFVFANDGKFEDSGDFVSKTLMAWAEERFGPLSQEQKILLLSVMYDIYKGSIGRCYGFTGEQLYYILNPERLPEGYGSVYQMHEESRETFRNMDYVQNDIVFSNFLSGTINMQDKQQSEEVLRELATFKESIQRGEPIIIGYLSRQMHHSMVVYGYFENLFRHKVTLLTANNWEREQNNNVFSEDAENIVIEIRGKEPSMSWYDLTKKRYRYPRRIFAVRREEYYRLSVDAFRKLMDEAREELIETDRSMIIVEKTETAYLENAEGKKQGYSKPRYFRELDEVSFRKIDYNYIFTFPADGEYRLFLKKRRYNKRLEEYKEANLFSIVPAGGDLISGMCWNLPVEDEEELVFDVSREGVRPFLSDPQSNLH
jgi:hypothetical protein